MKLDQDDKIIGVKICKDVQDIILSTQLGKCIRFMSKKLRVFKGRSSKGIKGMQLNSDDKIISLSILDSSNINSKTAKKLLKNGSSNKDKASEVFAKQKFILSSLDEYENEICESRTFCTFNEILKLQNSCEKKNTSKNDE
mgnify:CR=1 FL=1